MKKITKFLEKQCRILLYHRNRNGYLFLKYGEKCFQMLPRKILEIITMWENFYICLCFFKNSLIYIFHWNVVLKDLV